ncbi:MAG: SAM-dependent chlorinase/fluorinase, partial [Gemmatimonadota bacterium]
MACIITLLTDFGTRDGYVGAMKGAMASVHPGVDIHDVGHGLRQGDVRGAGQALARYWDRYPPGTVHVAVIDPGVGTERRAMAVEVEQRYLVVPDNGLV